MINISELRDPKLPTQLLKTLTSLALPNRFITPCLYGPTGVGKTTRVRNLAEELNIPLRTLLLGTLMPEEVLGLPRVVRSNGRHITRWTFPEWCEQAINKPTLLFLDELDKAPKDTLSAVLTLLTDRTVHNVALHPETRIVCAMQPLPDPDTFILDATGEALVARLLFIPTKANWGYLEKKYNLSEDTMSSLWLDTDEAYYDRDKTMHPPKLKTVSPRQMDWLLGILNHPGIDSHIHHIVAFMVREEWVSAVMCIISRKKK